jgi:hypothetical protein
MNTNKQLFLSLNFSNPKPPVNLLDSIKGFDKSSLLSFDHPSRRLGPAGMHRQAAAATVALGVLHITALVSAQQACIREKHESSD